MSPTYKPAGYPSVSPCLIVDGAAATSVQEPVKKGDADRRGGVEDSGGTTWWVATRVE